MRRILLGALGAIIGVAALPSVALAHVVVTPKTASVGQYLVFTVSIPNEKDSTVTALKLALPAGLTDVTPTIASGFDIATEKSGSDITSITWTGTIPVGQRADFSFGAQVPASATDLDWKAYQTYADGTTVHWDQTPSSSKGDDDSADAGPYSVTTVANDLTPTTGHSDSHADTSALPIVLSIAALVLAAAGLLIRRRRP